MPIPDAQPPSGTPSSQIRNAVAPKGTLLGTMPVVDESFVKQAQQQLKGGTQVIAHGKAAPLPEDDKNKK